MFEGTKYDDKICGTFKCDHGRDMHAANPFNEQQPRHCTTPGCRCGAFAPKKIERENAGRTAKPQPDAENARTQVIHHNTKPNHGGRAVSYGRMSFRRSA